MLRMRVELTFRQVLLIAAIGYAIYFPIALNLKLSYVPAPRSTREDGGTWLTGPFIPLAGAAYIAFLPKQEEQADSNEEPQKSKVVLYEDERQIGPPHSIHQAIIERGGGRYSHWKGQGLIFSSTDNSDPNQNWKKYWIKVE
jgi:hypothetical protein